MSVLSCASAFPYIGSLSDFSVQSEKKHQSTGIGTPISSGPEQYRAVPVYAKVGAEGRFY